jgi:dGTPase
MKRHGGRFNHNLHALRIVEQFEQRYPDHPGLNLTFEVREGIVKHSRDYVGKEAEWPELAEYSLELRPPLEAQLIDGVDEIAYNTADLDDAREAELLELEVLSRDVPIFGEAYERVNAKYPAVIEKLKFNDALKSVLDQLVTDLIETTSARVREAGVKTVDDVRRYSKRIARFSPELAQRNAELKRFLFANIYDRPIITEDRDRSVQCLAELFEYYLSSPESMPAAHEEKAELEPRHLVVCDYIAGMTDQFLLRQHHQVFGSAAAPSAKNTSA